MAVIHFTPSQVVLVISNYVIDEACTINYEITDEISPLYGFRDKTFRDISVGRTLVYGTLDINFIYRGYLTQMIARAPAKRDPAGLTERDQLRMERSLLDLATIRDAGLNPDELIDEEARREFIDQAFLAGDMEEYEDRLQAVKEMLWRIKQDGGGQNLEQILQDPEKQRELVKDIREGSVGGWSNNAILARPGLLKTPFDMSIVYGSVEEADNPLYTKVFKDCYIRGESMLVSAMVQGSEEVLMERYQFIAKTIV